VSGEIFGDVQNIAARAQALAERGSVMVTARVQRQIASLFRVCLSRRSAAAL
jgi:class 3 adenylate cyclase